MKKLLKWLGIAIGALVGLVAVMGAVFYVRSDSRINKTYDIEVALPPIPTDSAGIERGRHLVTAVLVCMHCHGEGLRGAMVIDAPGFMQLAAPNLTRGQGGVRARLDDTDWVRAIRHGVGRDRHALALMPADAYVHLSDADLGAVIAYVRDVPPVSNAVPARKFGPVARVLLARDEFPLFAATTINHAAVRSVSGPRPGVTSEYGRYLANIAGCISCHGPGVSGGPVPGAPPDAPPASNLTPGGISSYTEPDFFRALREGKRPGGAAINEFMPWKTFANMTDDELHALWRFLKTVPAREFGNR